MGYRSNIRCLIYPSGIENAERDEKYEALKTIMNTTFKEVFDMWSEHFTVDDTNMVIDFAIEDVKWYEGYPDVSAFDEMLPAIEDLGFVYEFVRVGEDSNDIEHRQSNAEHNGYLNTRTEIICHF